MNGIKKKIKKRAEDKIYFSNRTLYIVIIGILLIGVSLAVHASIYKNPTTGVGHDLSEIDFSNFKCTNTWDSIRTINPDGSVICDSDGATVLDAGYSSQTQGNRGYFQKNIVAASVSCTCGSDTCYAESEDNGGTKTFRARREPPSSPNYCNTGYQSSSPASCGNVTVIEITGGVQLDVLGGCSPSTPLTTPYN